MRKDGQEKKVRQKIQALSRKQWNRRYSRKMKNGTTRTLAPEAAKKNTKEIDCPDHLGQNKQKILVRKGPTTYVYEKEIFVEEETDEMAVNENIRDGQAQQTRKGLPLVHTSAIVS